MTTEPTHAERADDDADEDDEARVVLTTFAKLGAPLEAKLARLYGARAVWFFLEMDGEASTLFEQIPEDPIPKGHQDALMGALRNFTTSHNEALQIALGITDGITFGFHGDATYARVEEAFEKDGFFVCGTVENGEIVMLDDEPEGSESE